MSKHRCEARTRGVFRLHQEMSRLGCEAFMIELIENYPCTNMNELHKREGEITRELGASLNMRIAGRSHKEYAEEHRDKIELYKKERYDKNKENVRAIYKEMYDENPDKYREQAKQYRINNPELMKQKDKDRYQRHKEKTLAQQK